MAGPQLSFGGTSVVNPYENLINVLGKNGALAQNMVAGDEAKRLEQEQAYKNEMLGMQKAEHQIKVDESKQKLLEKEAANKYASALTGATSGNVVGLDDQAKLAAIAQDIKLTPEQQAVKMESVLPAMTKAYEKSPEEQLKMVRASNPLGGIENIAPTTRIALLKEAEAPMEKMQALNAAAANKREESVLRAQERAFSQAQTMNMQKMLADSANENRRAIAESRSTERRKTEEAKNLLPEFTATVNGAEKILSPASILQLQNEGAEISNIAKIGSKTGGSGSSGSGSSTGKKGTAEEGIQVGDVFIKMQDAKLLGVGTTSDTEDTVNTVKTLQALKYPPKAIQEAVNMQNALKTDNYFTKENADQFLEPLKTKDGVLIPPSIALKLADVQNKTLFLDSKNKFNLTEGTPPTDKQLAEIGIVRKVNSSGEKVLTDVNAAPVTSKVLPGVTEAERKYGGPYNPLETQSARNLRIQQAVDAEKVKAKVLNVDPYSTIDDTALENINALLRKSTNK